MTRTAVVAGVGPGLGASVARRFAAEGLQVALLARTESYLTELAAELDALEGEGTALPVPTELADPGDVARAFESVREAFGRVDVLVYNASAATWDGLLDCEPAAFDRALAVGVRGAFDCAREAASDMLADAADADAGMDAGGTPAGETRGVVVLTGATTSVRGRKGAVGFSAAKFGARGLAESMARELGPRGVHVAHVVIDGGIRPAERGVDDPEAYLDPDAVADAYWDLVEQDRSAWTLELDLRPYVEEF
jgi:NAD(P)-dependent dehydrogenase (short-subunit alcohol dehydrogenase family)